VIELTPNRVRVLGERTLSGDEMSHHLGERGSMSDQALPKLARCAKCGAWADLGNGIIGWNQRDRDLCKNPPIHRCTDMKAAVLTASPKT
jgi:hypothetical protein